MRLSLSSTDLVCVQGKTVWQAEIDAAAETIDFLRFNVKVRCSVLVNKRKI